MAVRRFREVADVLAADLARVPPGTRVPGEHEVADRFDVGRSTARAALHDLERRLVVRRVRGRGLFTTRRVDYPLGAPGAGPWDHTVVRACDPEPLPADVARVLGRDAGETAHRLARRSFTHELPAAWDVTWVPFAVLPELAVACRHETSLDVMLRDVTGAVPVTGALRASVEVADDDVVDHLGLELGDPVWFVEAVTAEASDRRPLALVRRWLRADAVRVVLQVE